MAHLKSVVISTALLTAVLVFLISFSEAESNDGLIAYYNFDEGTGEILNDVSGNGNNGRIYGAQWTSGKYGGALKFNGLDNYVGTSKHLMDNLEQYTLEGWINTSFVPPRGNGWQGQRNAFFGQKDVVQCGFLSIPAINDGNILCGLPWEVTNNTFRADEWHHFAIVGDSKSGRSLFIDGVAVKEERKAFKPSNSSYFFNIGGMIYEEKGDYFKGAIDEVKIYRRALSRDEIKAEYEHRKIEGINVIDNRSIPSSADSLIENFARSILGCKQGFQDCVAPQGDCETNVWADNNNCGECGKQCPAGYFCLLGSCSENTKEKKEELITLLKEEYNKSYASEKFDESRYYLLRIKDTYIELSQNDKASETDTKIEEVDKRIEDKAIKEEKIKELMKIAGSFLIALAFFVFEFRKRDKEKTVEAKKELIKKAVESVVVLLIFIALNQFLIPNFINSKIYATLFFSLAIGLISGIIYNKTLDKSKNKAGKRILLSLFVFVIVFILAGILGGLFLWGVLG